MLSGEGLTRHQTTLPDNNTLAKSKLKAYANDNCSAALIIKFHFNGLENLVEKGENTGHQGFLLFPLCFQKNSLRSFEVKG